MDEVRLEANTFFLRGGLKQDMFEASGCTTAIRGYRGKSRAKTEAKLLCID